MESEASCLKCIDCFVKCCKCCAVTRMRDWKVDEVVMIWLRKCWIATNIISRERERGWYNFKWMRLRWVVRMHSWCWKLREESISGMQWMRKVWLFCINTIGSVCKWIFKASNWFNTSSINVYNTLKHASLTLIAAHFNLNKSIFCQIGVPEKWLSLNFSLPIQSVVPYQGASSADHHILLQNSS